MQLDNTCNMEQELAAGVFQLLGEPSIVIHGLPPMGPQDGLVPCDIAVILCHAKIQVFVNGLVGREVRKLFRE